MKKEITDIALKNYIDEIRFVDSNDLTDEFLGDTSLFTGRQPRDILPSAKTVILFTVYIGKYVSPDSPLHGRTSKLVLSGFFTNVIQPLLPVKNYLESKGYIAEVVDGTSSILSVPLKGLAVKGGLGWIGKNTLLVSEKYGSFRALGGILTDADLAEEYTPQVNRCGNCSRCMEACPMSAILKPRQLKRIRCLSHIFDGGEHDPDIVFDRVDSKKYFFECDICQNHCPWNQRHIKNPLDTPYGQFYDADKISFMLQIEHLINMDEETYEKEVVPFMCGSVIPYPVFKRNLGVMLNHFQ